MSQKTYIEYAVDMHDIDAAMNTLASVWLRDDISSDEKAEKTAEQKHGWLFAGNAVEYESQGHTGRSRLITRDDTTKKIISDVMSGESSIDEKEYYKMET